MVIYIKHLAKICEKWEKTNDICGLILVTLDYVLLIVQK